MKAQTERILLGVSFIFIVSISIILFANSRPEENIQGEVIKSYLYTLDGKQVEPDDGIVKVGVITPLSGKYSFLGKESKDGITLALDHIKQHNLLPGQQLEISYKDSECDAHVAFAAAEALQAEGIHIILGADCYGYDAIPLTSDDSLILVTASALQNEDANFYALSPTFLDETSALFSAIKIPASMSIIYVNDDFGSDYAYALESTFPGKISSTYAYDVGKESFSSIAKKVTSRNPESVFIVTLNHEHLRSALLALYTQGYHNQVFTNIIVDDAYLESIGTDKYAFEHVIMVADYDPTAKRSKVQDFKLAAKNKGMITTDTTAEAYDSIILLAKLINQQGEHPALLSEAMQALRNHEGVTGMISMQETGVLKTYSIRKVVDGKAVSLS